MAFQDFIINFLTPKYILILNRLHMLKVILIGIITLLLCSCTTANSDVVLQSISFNPNTANMHVGDVLQLDPEFTPAVFNSIPVVWSTSDAQIATVDVDGSVEAISPGQVIITVKDQHSATSGECHITVVQ
jgi:uncharacterized protein YjdB